MLAEVLESTRDQVAEELERRAAASESTELPLAGRRKRLAALVREVIWALRRGHIEATPQPPRPSSAALELRERELVRRYLIERIEHRQLDASPGETAIVAQWAGHMNCQRLRTENDRLRVLLDNVHESAALFGADGRILYCNRQAAQALRETVGVPRGEIVGKTPAELGMPGELLVGRPIEELIPRARGRESFEMNAWGRDKEGRFDAVYGKGETVDAVALVVRDVHDHRLAETRLELLTKLSTLTGILDFEEVAEALVHVPIPELADWCAVNLVERSRITRSFLAHRDPARARLREEIMRAMPNWERHPLWQTMLTSGLQLLSEVNDDLLRRLSVSEEQYRLLSRMGLQSAMVVPLVSRGELTGIITFAYTAESGRRYRRYDAPLAEELALHAAQTFENARLLKDLKASEARFRIALAGARTAVYEQDTALRYVWYYNPLVALNPVGKSHEATLPEDEARPLTALKRRVLDEGESISEEMDFTFRGEERRHFRETMEPLRNQSGRIVGVIGAATDITELHSAQNQLTAELAFRERMMGILGHDLRSPLGTIVMAADLLLRRPEPDAADRDRALRIRRAAGRMQEMIDTLLDFSRARFLGKVPVQRVPADMGEIAHGAIDELRLTWPDHSIELAVSGDPRGEWDPARMAQTVTNLVGNAIAYGESGTPVKISIDSDDHCVELKVHNQGPPIPADLMPVLFQPFRRGLTDDRSPRGLGLGLYIVQQIVYGHEGTIAVDSTAEDGTTFTLHLPRRDTPPPAPASPVAGDGRRPPA
jgi:signal transduction histidine kinase